MDIVPGTTSYDQIDTTFGDNHLILMNIFSCPGRVYNYSFVSRMVNVDSSVPETFASYGIKHDSRDSDDSPCVVSDHWVIAIFA